MTKTWLTRRSVRRLCSPATTACIKMSVCNAPFISTSAAPASAISTAFAAAASALATETSSYPEMSMPDDFAADLIVSDGPIMIGTISFALAASTAPTNETASVGLTMAVRIGSRFCA